MSTEGGSFGGMSLHVGTDWHVQCHTYPEATPILSVDASGIAVSISIAWRAPATAEAAVFARELARQAARFAIECERLSAATGGAATGGPGGSPEAA